MDADPDDWVEAELGCDVYGLGSVFEAARVKRLPRPETTEQLRALLREHLYVEGGADYVRLDEHSLRVRTDDDEVELAYFFLDEHAVAGAPQRLAYVLYPSWPLPEEAGTSAWFTAEVPVRAVTGPGPQDDTTECSAAASNTIWARSRSRCGLL